jgi:hypothetical protein
MNATATKSTTQRLSEKIEALRQEASEAEGKKEYELMFILLDKADQLQSELDQQ